MGFGDEKNRTIMRPLQKNDLKMIRPGDTMVISGVGLVASGIKVIANTSWTHTGLMDRIDKYLRVLECDWRHRKNGAGVVFSDFYEYIDSEAFIMIIRPKFIIDIAKFNKFCIDNVGRINYSYWDLIFANPVYLFTEKYLNCGIWLGSSEKNLGHMDCSGLCGYCYNYLRPDIKEFKNFKSLRPDFFGDNQTLFYEVCTIHKRQIDIRI